MRERSPGGTPLFYWDFFKSLFSKPDTFTGGAAKSAAATA